MKTSTIFLITIVFTIHPIFGQSINKIVRQIAKVNEVQDLFIGRGSDRSVNYQNFERLKEIADISTLVELVDHRNAVVACYASWALIDNEYYDLVCIFQKLLKSDRHVVSSSGDLTSMRELVSSVFYHRYWNKTVDRETNQTLIYFDSLIIYHDKPDWLLLSRALENRHYSPNYNERIAWLAFEQLNRNTIFYLLKWDKPEYNIEIKNALLEYLLITEFRNVGTTAYLETVSELLKFNDSNLVPIVIEKLKKDSHWKYAEIEFKTLLNQYNINLDYNNE